MTRPTKTQMEESDQPNITGTWQERIWNKMGSVGLAIVGIVYIYNDGKALQAQQFANMRDSNLAIMTIVKDNGKMVTDNTQALRALVDQIEESHRNLALMDKTIYSMDAALKVIEKNTTPKTQQ